jgi:hypothetical protein
MHCYTCRYELSQCLDGRLPSGRRAVVMQHVDGCAACAAFWAELQAAQQLSLQLPKQRVSDGFRDQLWERIRAGEGTPAAVFHEPVPLLTKARYLLTGAAAAAAVLLFATWLRQGDPLPAGQDQVANAPTHPQTDPLHPRNDQFRAPGPQGQGVVTQGLMPRGLPQDTFASDATPSMLAMAQPLTADLVAVEAARQFEQRYLSANQSLVRLDDGNRGADERLVGRILDEAGELRVFAEVLLELRKDNRVFFRDAELGADLRLVANLLDRSRRHERNLDTVHTFVVPALQQNPRLGTLAQQIGVRPTFDPFEERAEQELLQRLSRQLPDVFPKLFVVFPDHDPGEPFGSLRRGEVFRIDDECGPRFVAPLSRIEEGNQRLRLMIESKTDRDGQVHVEVYVNGQKKND